MSSLLRSPHRQAEAAQWESPGAARIAAAAKAEQVLVSRTVKDLVAGSRLVFDDQGEHQFKGVTDPWRLYVAHRDETRRDQPERPQNF